MLQVLLHVTPFGVILCPKGVTPPPVPSTSQKESAHLETRPGASLRPGAQDFVPLIAQFQAREKVHACYYIICVACYLFYYLCCMLFILLFVLVIKILMHMTHAHVIYNKMDVHNRILFCELFSSKNLTSQLRVFV